MAGKWMTTKTPNRARRAREEGYSVKGKHKMRDQLERRLQSLRQEYETGQKMLADLEAQQANLRETLLRISGAIRVLEEALAEASPPTADDVEPPEGASEAVSAADE